MKYRELGNTGIRVSEIGMGCWAIGGSWGRVNDRQSIETLRLAYDLGCNFYDTANIYGHGRSEELIRKAFEGVCLEKIIIASKGGCEAKNKHGNFSKKFILDSCEDSLKRLGRDYIDVYQLHSPTMDQLKDGQAFEALELLREQGKIRIAGISVNTVEMAFYAVDHLGARSVQIIYNLFRHKPAEEFFPYAFRKGVGIIVRVPLASGLLTDKFKPGAVFPSNDHRRRLLDGESFSGVPLETGLEAVRELRKIVQPGYKRMVNLALRWILDNPHVSTVIPGAKYTFQVRRNLEATDMPPLTAGQNLAIRDIYQKRIASLVQNKY